MADVDLESRPETERDADAARVVTGWINYVAREPERPSYHANDSSRDTIVLDPAAVLITDARSLADAPRLDREGFVLVQHRTAITDFRDREAVAAIHPEEIRRLLLDVSGADEVIVNGAGVLRFGERSTLSGALDNSKPARFVHIDVSDRTAAQFALRAPPRPGVMPRRVCHFNVWRTFSTPPQDTPLTLCDARSVEPQDRLLADAVFDQQGKPDWSFEGLVVARNPAHRWIYWSDMTRDDVLVFVTNDSDPTRPHDVPHSAFNDPNCPPDAEPRASIEMRGIAYWY